jgi:hypothetical protein
MIKTVHCIYQHSNPTTGEIFYIGLGTKDRPYNFNTGRSKEWQERYDNASSWLGKWYCQLQIDKFKKKLYHYEN